MAPSPLVPPLDALVIGGGIAGLWTLDALDEAGFATALVESTALGHGQTLASQGIIHGGIKYTLSGLLHPSAQAISAMPERWREAMRGVKRPDLRSVRVASESTWLWRSTTLTSKLALVGARVGLRSTTTEVPAEARPPLLAEAPGSVFRVDEPVLDTVSVCEAFLATHGPRLIHGSVAAIKHSKAGWRLTIATATGRIELTSHFLVFAAGASNEELRTSAGCTKPRMQRRPLHMALVRGNLPELFGHCVDATSTRVTITTHRDSRGRNVWQLGGNLAEDGVGSDSAGVARRAAAELKAVLPGFDVEGKEWSAYRIDRAERSTSGGARPEDADCIVENDVATIWPTKLALAPRAAELAHSALRRTGVARSGRVSIEAPRPPVGLPPWETATWSALR